MTRLRDLTGKVFSRLTVLGREPGEFKRVMWRVECACGAKKVVAGIDLTTNHTKSCGCWRLEVFSRAGKKTAVANSRKGAAKAAATRTRHGRARRAVYSGTYHSWEAMIQRCTNPKNVAYRHYGEIGVLVCERWRTFDLFLEDMGERPDGLTIDRINPFGNYEPGNCRWADRATQSRNTRRKHAAG